MAQTQILQVAVDKITEKMIRQQAKKESISVSAVIRQAVNHYLAITAEASRWKQKTTKKESAA